MAIAVVIFAFIITAGTMIFDEQIDSYNINVTNKEFESAEDYIHDLNETVVDMKNKLKPTGIGIADALNFLIAGAGAAITVAWSTLTMPLNIIMDITGAFGLHPIVATSLTVMIMISILFGLVYLYFRFQPRND